MNILNQNQLNSKKQTTNKRGGFFVGKFNPYHKEYAKTTLSKPMYLWGKVIDKKQ